MKYKLLLAAAIFVVFSGLVMLLYPVFSNILFQKKQQELIDYYENQVQQISDEKKDDMLERCREYNQELMNQHIKILDPFNSKDDITNYKLYSELLDVYGNGAMGYIDIPAIDCKLLIYHGTDNDTLAKGVGHLIGTSLPIGGEGTHAVLSAHTGTADKTLFTNLDQLKNGDNFYIYTLGTTLAYKVDDIRVVFPSETSSLNIKKDKDYVTLVTCTPYGVNSHRLLVRGSRVEYNLSEEVVTDKKVSTWAKQYMYAIIVGIVIAFLITGTGFLIYRFRYKVNKKENE